MPFKTNENIKVKWFGISLVKQNITCPLVDMNMIFSCSTRYVTRLPHPLARYRVERSKITFIFMRGHEISSIHSAGGLAIDNHRDWNLKISATLTPLRSGRCNLKTNFAVFSSLFMATSYYFREFEINFEKIGARWVRLCLCIVLLHYVGVFFKKSVSGSWVAISKKAIT